MAIGKPTTTIGAQAPINSPHRHHPTPIPGRSCMSTLGGSRTSRIPPSNRYHIELLSAPTSSVVWKADTARQQSTSRVKSDLMKDRNRGKKNRALQPESMSTPQTL